MVGVVETPTDKALSGSGHYLPTKARCYVAMVSCLETGYCCEGPHSRAEHRGNVNNTIYGVSLISKVEYYYNLLRFRTRDRLLHIRLRSWVISVPCYDNG